MENESRQAAGQRFTRGASWVFYGFLAIGAFFLFAEHRAHLLGWLPFLLLALCPLMHFFHGGHGGHGGGNSGSDASTRSSSQQPTHKH